MNYAKKNNGKNWYFRGGIIVVSILLIAIIVVWGGRKILFRQERQERNFISKLERDLITNRGCLKDYFIIHTPSDLEKIERMKIGGEITNSIRARIKDTLLIDFNRGIKRKEGWDQKRICVFDFKSDRLLPYIVFKKNHNYWSNEMSQFSETFYFDCNYTDSYWEFNTKEEAIDFLKKKNTCFTLEEV